MTTIVRPARYKQLLDGFGRYVCGHPSGKCPGELGMATRLDAGWWFLGHERGYRRTADGRLAILRGKRPGPGYEVPRERRTWKVAPEKMAGKPREEFLQRIREARAKIDAGRQMVAEERPGAFPSTRGYPMGELGKLPEEVICEVCGLPYLCSPPQ